MWSTRWATSLTDPSLTSLNSPTTVSPLCLQLWFWNNVTIISTLLPTPKRKKAPIKWPRFPRGFGGHPRSFEPPQGLTRSVDGSWLQAPGIPLSTRLLLSFVVPYVCWRVLGLPRMAAIDPTVTWDRILVVFIWKKHPQCYSSWDAGEMKCFESREQLKVLFIQPGSALALLGLINLHIGRRRALFRSSTTYFVQDRVWRIE